MAAACAGNQENLSLQDNSLLIHSSVIGVKLRSQSSFAGSPPNVYNPYWLILTRICTDEQTDI